MALGEVNAMKKAFTLIELLVVVAIMGLLGSASVGGYRAMQRGMEERGVMQNVNQFIRSAYQRAQIDRTLVAVYFWNETIQEETSTDPLIVVGKAVAVRRAGRLTAVDGKMLVDEFADLRFSRLSIDEDDIKDKDNVKGVGDVYLYPMNGASDNENRSLVYQNTTKYTINDALVQSGQTASIPSYAFLLSDNDKGEVAWKIGDAYGFEFSELQLPNNYVFGTGKPYSDRITSPIAGRQVLHFKPGLKSASGSVSGGTFGASTIVVSSLRPGPSGDLDALKVGTSERPDQSLAK